VFERLQSFWNSDAGAVTVEYVLLVALVAALGTGALFQVSAGTGTLTGKISGALDAMDVVAAYDAGTADDGQADDDGADDDNHDRRDRDRRNSDNRDRDHRD
jgi:Flp pilus assembly pilin Flp